MKRKASATALVLFITLLFATGTSTKAATFSAGDTLGGKTTFTSPMSGRLTKDWGTRFTATGTAYTLDEGTFATNTGGQYFKSGTWSTVNTSSNQRWFTTTRFSSGTVKTSTASTVGVTKRFTSEQRGNTDFDFTDTTKFFDETNQNVNQFF